MKINETRHDCMVRRPAGSSSSMLRLVTMLALLPFSLLNCGGDGQPTSDQETAVQWQESTADSTADSADVLTECSPDGCVSGSDSVSNNVTACDELDSEEACSADEQCEWVVLELMIGCMDESDCPVTHAFCRSKDVAVSTPSTDLPGTTSDSQPGETSDDPSVDTGVSLPPAGVTPDDSDCQWVCLMTEPVQCRQICPSDDTISSPPGVTVPDIVSATVINSSDG